MVVFESAVAHDHCYRSDVKTLPYPLIIELWGIQAFDIILRKVVVLFFEGTRDVIK
jgi:hypothetical protein